MSETLQLELEEPIVSYDDKPSFTDLEGNSFTQNSDGYFELAK